MQCLDTTRLWRAILLMNLTSAKPRCIGMRLPRPSKRKGKNEGVAFSENRKTGSCCDDVSRIQFVLGFRDVGQRRKKRFSIRLCVYRAFGRTVGPDTDSA